MSTKTIIAVEALSSTVPQAFDRDPKPVISETTMEIDSEDCKKEPNSAVFSVQPDWYQSLREEDGKAWITFKQQGQLGIHAKIISEGESKDGEIFNLSCDDEEFKLSEITSKSFSISHSKAKSLNFKIIRPEMIFSSIHSKNVSSLDVSSGGLGVSAGDDGSSLFVWETSKGVVRRNLEGHYGDIYNCKLFPSGIVVLSSGSDMRIKIWSAEDGSCPVTLTGHTAAVTDTAIVDKGMNIVSISKDGTIRVWSCGKGKCLEPPISIDDVANSCDIVNFGESPYLMTSSAGDNIDHENDIGLENKLFAVGGENGTIALISLYSRSVLATKKLPGKIPAVNAVSFINKEKLLIGCENGKVLCLSVPDLDNIWTLHDSDSPIMSLLSLSTRNGFIVGKQDGTCIFYRFNSYNHPMSNKVLLSGADADPINTIKCDGVHVYTGARDGKIRKYNVLHM